MHRSIIAKFKTDGLQVISRMRKDIRVAKMLLRIVGEMRLGWKRASDPTDLMYAPIMFIDDIDRMSLSHTIQQRKQRQ